MTYVNDMLQVEVRETNLQITLDRAIAAVLSKVGPRRHVVMQLKLGWIHGALHSADLSWSTLGGIEGGLVRHPTWVCE